MVVKIFKDKRTNTFQVYSKYPLIRVTGINRYEALVNYKNVFERKTSKCLRYLDEAE